MCHVPGTGDSTGHASDVMFDGDVRKPLLQLPLDNQQPGKSASMTYLQLKEGQTLTKNNHQY